MNLLAIPNSDADALLRMYNRMKGSSDFFSFQNPNQNPVLLETVGSGDGAKSVFYLGQNVDFGTGDLVVVPGSLTLKRSIGGTGDFLTFAAYTIDNSFGQITTNAPLPSNDVLRADSYRFYYRVRFKDDTLTRDVMSPELWNVSVQLIEVI